jgi:hypothetical protein
MNCFDHPDVETGLRCNQCGQPICAKCARRVPVGYRCRDCIRAQQAVFYTSGWLDYACVITVALVASFVAALIGAVTVGSSIWLAVFLGPVAGGAIAEAIRRAARRRRGRYMTRIVRVCVVIGALPTLLFVASSLWTLGGLVTYVAIVVSTVYTRLQ